jgi:MFS family permease
MGFAAKPVGSIFLSKIGDLYGRKKVLFISILGMLLSTLLIGFSPSYAEIGWQATALLIFARTLQGACISAEGDGVRVFAMEHWGERKYSLANGFSSLSCSGGIFMASYLAGSVLDFGFSWQWLFIMGGVLSLGILLLRLSMDETPDFAHALQDGEALSTWDCIQKNKTLIIYMAIFAGLNGAIYYYLAVFINGYLADILEIIDQKQGVKISNAYLFGYASVTLALGYFADKIDKIIMIKVFSFGLVVCSASMVYCAAHNHYPLFLFGILGVLTFGMVVPIMPLMMERTTVRDRFRVISIGHAVGSTALAGTAPLIGSLLHEYSQSALLTLSYPVLLAVCYFITITCFSRNFSTASS